MKAAQGSDLNGFAWKIRLALIKEHYMTVEEQIMELKEKQAFWQGVVRGVIGSAVFFAGLVTLIYYMIQIVDVLQK